MNFKLKFKVILSLCDKILWIFVNSICFKLEALSRRQKFRTKLFDLEFFL